MIHLTTVQKIQLVEKIHSFFMTEIYDHRTATCPKCDQECDLDGEAVVRVNKQNDLDFFVDDILKIINV